MQITALDPERDARVVRSWLTAHVRDHLRTWTAATGDPWDDEKIVDHIQAQGLVDREWKDLSWAAKHTPRGHVSVARVDGRAAGVLWAEERADRFLCRPVAALCWVYTAKACRGRGVAEALMTAYDQWAATRPVVAREVYVTSSNEPALRLYERHGLIVSDHRMFAPGPGTLGAPSASLAVAQEVRA